MTSRLMLRTEGWSSPVKGLWMSCSRDRTTSRSGRESSGISSGGSSCLRVAISTRSAPRSMRGFSKFTFVIICLFPRGPTNRPCVSTSSERIRSSCAVSGCLKHTHFFRVSVAHSLRSKGSESSKYQLGRPGFALAGTAKKLQS
ncbi:hypothetical protein BC938DRAFT_475278 [Jimgerdemannia flammicorona]|uniref:Uncharacterized protein n=1 Tax=Jimgerdemannia flammicorona TaxID=994334 RepID=A0A433QRT0_9FUNG|nr:hypothetical protein BC938DRAFT_475278 [Jimgerdemannia flammicorona]